MFWIINSALRGLEPKKVLMVSLLDKQDVRLELVGVYTVDICTVSK